MARGDGQGGCACASRRMRGGRGRTLAWAGLDGPIAIGRAQAQHAAGGVARRMMVRTIEEARAKRMQARVSSGRPGVPGSSAWLGEARADAELFVHFHPSSAHSR